MLELPPVILTPSFWTACLAPIIIYFIFSYFIPTSSTTDGNSKYKKIPKIFYDPAIRAIFTGSLGNLPALHARHGDLVSVTFIGEKAILVGGLSNIRAVLNNENFQADLPKPMVKLIGQGNLQTVHGKQHARDRKILSPIFTPTNLKGYVPRVADLAQNTVAAWEKVSNSNKLEEINSDNKSKSTRSGGGNGDESSTTTTTTATSSNSILAYTEIRKYVLRVGLELVLGFDASKTSLSEYDRVSGLFTDLWAGFFTVPVDVPGSNYRKALKARNELRKTILSNLEDLLNETHTTTIATTTAADSKDAEEENSDAGGRTALELLMESKDEEGNPIPKDHIMTLVTGLMLGALDTTATTLMLALRRFALHPEVLAQARAEQEDIIAQHGSEMTFEILKQMRYLDGVLKETIRLQTPVQIVFRRAVQECEIGGYLIPAGRKILVHVGEAIVNDERWQRNNDLGEEKGDRNAFKPERWLSEQGSKVGGWLPFGGGVRLCPGQQLAWTEMKLLLATIARGYDVELVDPREKWAIFPLQKPKNGMPIRVTKHN